MPHACGTRVARGLHMCRTPIARVSHSDCTRVALRLHACHKLIARVSHAFDMGAEKRVCPGGPLASKCARIFKARETCLAFYDHASTTFEHVHARVSHANRTRVTPVSHACRTQIARVSHANRTRVARVSHACRTRTRYTLRLTGTVYFKQYRNL